ncbi:Gfo/Idh/MocA family protein [Jiangella alba]|uniref:Predicted dehydrogenase n=1 Tax=Jiangella alba TaxID=561176 RepID=A0A1H5JDB2_9ACTN|nr:Gfo/Idh/MocA family oxidoreductase [Jiangella alba]SEE49638.1 Predicted dehydrogenase [Jiangella alba]
MNARPQVLRVGILSFAHPHAISYAGVLAARPDVHVRATDPGVHASGEVRGAELAAQLGVEYADDVDQLLSWQPHAVIVTSENVRHREHVERVAAAGAHVLCEKPLATSEPDARAIVAACERADVVLMTAYPVRFAPEFVRLLEVVRAGELGRILSVNGTNNGKIPLGERSWFTDASLSGGGSLVDHVVHVADLLDELFEAQPADRVHAVVNRTLHAVRPGIDVETGGLVSVRYLNGATAVIDCSWSHPDSAPNWGGLTLEVVGSRGIARIDPFAKHVGGFGPSGAVRHDFGADMDASMLAEFLAAVREGRSARPDGRAGLRSLQVVLAAQASVQSGGPITLDQVEELGRIAL